MTNLPNEMTIKDLANLARRQAYEVYGGPVFVRLCMNFDYRVCKAALDRSKATSQPAEERPDSTSFNSPEPQKEEELRKVEEVLLLLAQETTAGEPTTEMQLAFCWLDAKGFGAMEVTRLNQALEQIRRRSLGK